MSVKITIGSKPFMWRPATEFPTDLRSKLVLAYVQPEGSLTVGHMYVKSGMCLQNEHNEPIWRVDSGPNSKTPWIVVAWHPDDKPLDLHRTMQAIRYLQKCEIKHTVPMAWYEDFRKVWIDKEWIQFASAALKALGPKEWAAEYQQKWKEPPGFAKGGPIPAKKKPIPIMEAGPEMVMPGNVHLQLKELILPNMDEIHAKVKKSLEQVPPAKAVIEPLTVDKAGNQLLFGMQVIVSESLKPNEFIVLSPNKLKAGMALYSKLQAGDGNTIHKLHGKLLKHWAGGELHSQIDLSEPAGVDTMPRIQIDGLDVKVHDLWLAKVYFEQNPYMGDTLKYAGICWVREHVKKIYGEYLADKPKVLADLPVVQLQSVIKWGGSGVTGGDLVMILRNMVYDVGWPGGSAFQELEMEWVSPDFGAGEVLATSQLKNVPQTINVAPKYLRVKGKVQYFGTMSWVPFDVVMPADKLVTV